MFTALLFANLLAYAQKDSVRNNHYLYPPQQLHADLAFVKHVLEEAHPSLYRYTPKDTIDMLFARADEKLDSPLTAFQFWKIAAPVVAAVRSAHTTLSFSYLDAPWIGVKRDTIMPLFVFLRSGHIYAASFPPNTGMPPGAEIKAIDGHRASEILHNVRSYLPSEGRNHQFADFILENYGFGQNYNAFYGFKAQYNITYADSSGSTHHTTINNHNSAIAYWMKGIKPNYKPDTSLLSRDVQIGTFPDMPSTIMLKIKNLTYTKDVQDFDLYFFKRLQDENMHNLIIDLRGNTGGFASLNYDMMRYLVKGDFVLKTHNVLAVTDRVDFKKYVLPGSDPFTRTLTRIKKNVYAAEGEMKWGYLKSRFYHFDGKIYILIDKGTFSAATLLAANLRAQADVTIIGEESGGGAAGTDGYGFWNIRLPSTSLTLRLPQYWVQTTLNDANQGLGLMPDIPVKPHIADRMSRRDVALNTALQLIVSSNN